MRVFGLPAGFARLAKYSRVDIKAISEKAQFKGVLRSAAIFRR